jgi:hypothetical protein
MTREKLAWSIIPPDCKEATAKIKRLGRMDEARDEILADAEATLKRLGHASALDYCFAIECAAERWLKRQAA